MKRTLLFLFLFVFLFGLLAACSSSGNVPSGDYLLLKAIHSNHGETSSEDDYWSSDTYMLYANGKMEITASYNLSGKTNTTIYLNADEVSKIAKLIRDQKSTPDNLDGCDGSVWNIEHYDEKGNVVVDYNGYIFDGKLQELTTLLNVAQSNSAPNNAFLTARNSFVGINETTRKETWFVGEWTIYYDGKVVYTYNAGDMDAPVTIEKQVDEETIDEIRNLMNKQKDTTSDAVMDAEEWTFNYFDKNGKTLKHFDGTIYDFDNLNSLADILSTLTVE